MEGDDNRSEKDGGGEPSQYEGDSASEREGPRPLCGQEPRNEESRLGQDCGRRQHEGNASVIVDVEKVRAEGRVEYREGCE